MPILDKWIAIFIDTVHDFDPPQFWDRGLFYTEWSTVDVRR